MAGPLSHLRVLDLSRILAGPWAGQVFADLGADVIKVERPGTGDDTRAWGPPFLKDSAGNDTQESAYYLCANRAKRSVEADISTPRGQEIIKRLAEKSDIVLENYKAGGLRKYGLDYDNLKAVNPGLVYCSVTGFGHSGPYVNRAGYDFLIQGMSGLMSVTGRPDNAPGGEPVKTGVALSDILTGLYGVIGVLAALEHRNKTGEGQHIDLALLDVQVAAMANQASNYLISGKTPGRLGNAHPNIVPYQVFKTADGHIILAVGNDGQFKKFCAVAGRPELAYEDRFATNKARVMNRKTLIPLLEALIEQRISEDWLHSLEAASVPCGPINNLEEVFEDPQVQARGMQVDLDHPGGTRVSHVANPLKFSKTPLQYTKSAPMLGQHTQEVLRDVLGLGDDEIEDLTKESWSPG